MFSQTVKKLRKRGEGYTRVFTQALENLRHHNEEVIKLRDQKREQVRSLELELDDLHEMEVSNKILADNIEKIMTTKL